MSDGFAGTLGAVSAEFIGAEGSGAITGTIAARLAAVQASIGTPGTLAGTLGSVQGSVAGSLGAIGGIEATLCAVAASFTGNLIVGGSFASALPAVSGSITGLVGSAGSMEARLGGLTGALAGYVGIVGTVVVQLPAIRAAFDGYEPIVGTFAVTLPAVHFVARGQLTGVEAAYSLNLQSRGLSLYENYGFNSFAKFNGVYLGANADGIFALTGADDDGAAIDALIRTGITDFGSSEAKRVEYLWLNMRTDGGLQVRCITDDNEDYTYDVDAVRTRAGEGLGNVPVKPGKGLDARNWQLEITNLDGADFEIGSLEVVPTVFQRKRGG